MSGWLVGCSEGEEAEFSKSDGKACAVRKRQTVQNKEGSKDSASPRGEDADGIHHTGGGAGLR